MADVEDESVSPPGPVVWRRWLTGELVQLRNAADIKQSDVARELRCSVAKVSYLESGDRLPSLRELKEVLLPLYRVAEEDWQAYFDAAEAAHQPAWWDSWDEEDLPKQFRRYVGLEAGVRHLRAYHPSIFPGLLQTPKYARAILEADVMHAPLRIGPAVELRQMRQRILSREVEPPKVRFVLDESALRRPIGGPATFRAQLNHLIQVAKTRPNVELQVVPFSVGAHGVFLGQFTIMDFGGVGDPLVFVEGFNEFRFVETRRVVRRYMEAFDRLTERALGPAESIKMVQSLASSVERGLD